jgi:hypothetical protein
MAPTRSASFFFAVPLWKHDLFGKSASTFPDHALDADLDMHDFRRHAEADRNDAGAEAA